MDWKKAEHDSRPVAAGIVVLLTVIVLLGAAVRDIRPHEVPVGISAPQQVADQLVGGFAQNAPGAFAFTTYSTEAAARSAVDSRDVVGAIVVGAAGPTLVVAGASGEAVAGGVTTAFTKAFEAQGTPLAVEVVHPFGAGDPHGIVLFFLVLATVISSVVVGAITALTMKERGWIWQSALITTFPVAAGIVGTLTAAFIANDYWSGIFALMAVITLLSLAVAFVVAGAARLMGPAGVGLAVLVVVLISLVSSGGPLGSYFLPDLYRAVAPWLPVDTAYSAARGVLYFDGAGVAGPALVLCAWAVVGVIALVARDVRMPARARTAQAAA
jgi:hypothetical protein